MGVGITLTALTVVVLLLLIALEAKLTLAGQRKLAAGASGLAVLAAFGLLVRLTLLASRLWDWLSGSERKAPSSARTAAGDAIEAAEPPLPAERAERRS